LLSDFFDKINFCKKEPTSKNLICAPTTSTSPKRICVCLGTYSVAVPTYIVDMTWLCHTVGTRPDWSS
jgi:hypothetical protein